MLRQALFNFYRIAISPWLVALGAQCRFEKSCSRYAQDSIAVHGWIKGSLLAGRRLLCCAPWHPGDAGHGLEK